MKKLIILAAMPRVMAKVVARDIVEWELLENTAAQ